MDAGGQLEIDSVIMTLTALIKVAIAESMWTQSLTGITHRHCYPGYLFLYYYKLMINVVLVLVDILMTN